uniref:Uncharacterized protein n=1 Tax=Anguilla anguilla TaxID=7936 RepID=A0A0E9SR10_ANGAN
MDHMPVSIIVIKGPNQ